MRVRTKLAAVTGGLVLASMPLATASASPQPDTVTAAAAKYCVDNHHGAEACFQPYGDKVLVKDTRKDGYSAAGYWETQGDYGRKGTCVNSRGVGTWVVCNYNLKEDRRLAIYAVDIDVPSWTWRYWSADRVITT